MPVNEFMKPRVAQHRVTYVDQYVPPPFELIGKKLQQEQKLSDAVEQASIDIVENVRANYLPGDEQAVLDRKDYYRSQIEESLEQSGGDYRQLRGTIKKLGTELRDDLEHGDLFKANIAFSSAQSSSKRLNELEKGAKETYKGEREHLARALQRYNISDPGTGRAGFKKTGGPFGARDYHRGIDFNTVIKDAASFLQADGRVSFNFDDPKWVRKFQSTYVTDAKSRDTIKSFVRSQEGIREAAMFQMGLDSEDQVTDKMLDDFIESKIAGPVRGETFQKTIGTIRTNQYYLAGYKKQLEKDDPIQFGMWMLRNQESPTGKNYGDYQQFMTKDADSNINSAYGSAFKTIYGTENVGQGLKELYPGTNTEIAKQRFLDDLVNGRVDTTLMNPKDQTDAARVIQAHINRKNEGIMRGKGAQEAAQLASGKFSPDVMAKEKLNAAVKEGFGFYHPKGKKTFAITPDWSGASAGAADPLELPQRSAQNIVSSLSTINWKKDGYTGGLAEKKYDKRVKGEEVNGWTAEFIGATSKAGAFRGGATTMQPTYKVFGPNGKVFYISGDAYIGQQTPTGTIGRPGEEEPQNAGGAGLVKMADEIRTSQSGKKYNDAYKNYINQGGNTQTKTWAVNHFGTYTIQVPVIGPDGQPSTDAQGRTITMPKIIDTSKYAEHFKKQLTGPNRGRLNNIKISDPNGIPGIDETTLGEVVKSLAIDDDELEGEKAIPVEFDSPLFSALPFSGDMIINFNATRKGSTKSVPVQIKASDFLSSIGSSQMETKQWFVRAQIQNAKAAGGNVDIYDNNNIPIGRYIKANNRFYLKYKGEVSPIAKDDEVDTFIQYY